MVPGSVRATPSVSAASYIVQGLDPDQVARAVEACGGTVTSRLDIIDGVGALLTPQMVDALRADPSIHSITPNGSVKVSGNGRNNIPATEYLGSLKAPMERLPGEFWPGRILLISFPSRAIRTAMAPM